MFTVEHHQVTITRCYHELFAPLSVRGQPELLGEFLLGIAVFDECVFLILGVIAIHAFVIGLHPHVLTGVNIESVDTALDAPLGQLRRRITVHTLRHRVEDTEVHALLQPQSSQMVLPDTIHVVVSQRSGVVRIVIEGTETVAVITVQSVRGTYPYESSGVLIQEVNCRVRKSVTRVQTTEFHIGNHIRCGIHSKAE